MSGLVNLTRRIEKLERRFARPQLLSHEDQMLKERCEASFYEFIKHAWIYLEGRPYIDGWHVQAIAEHLQALQQLQIRDLLINIPFRHGKPVEENTLLLRSDGMRICIKDIKIGDKVLTDSGIFRKVLAKYDQGVLPVLNIKTFQGRVVTAAYDHPFLTAKGWVNAEDLKVDDLLVTTSVRNDFGIPLDIREARLIGYIIGDGCVLYNCCSISCSDELRMQDIELCVDTLGFKCSKRPRWNSKTGITTYKISIKNGEKNLKEWLISHNLKDKTSYTKVIPNAVMTGNFNYIANFLGAYYSCDANLESGRNGVYGFSLSSVSKSLLETTQHLLLRLGIRSSLRKKIGKFKSKRQGDIYVSYRLNTIDQDNVYLFLDKIPLFSSRFKDLDKKKIIRRYLDNPLGGDAVESIDRDGEKHCYCLEIEKDHTFTANDLIVHNSLIAGASFSAWCWAIQPELRFLYTSYAQNLSVKDAVACRRLITSNWYQKLWGSQYYLMGDVNNKLRFDNSKHGYRLASSVGGAITGLGADVVCVDDPNNINEVNSEVIRQGVNDWWDFVMSTRFCTAATGRRLVIQQRANELDLSGWILAKNDPSWVHLCLPAEFEPHRRSVTIPLPMSNNEVWMDPRQEEGELLWPQGMDAEALEKIKKNFNNDSYVIACQLQQRPFPAEGAILKEEWFKAWKQRDLPEFEYILQSWDTSLTKKDDTSCYNACTTWGIFKDRGGINNVMLLSVFKEKMEYPELRKAATRLANNYNDIYFDEPSFGRNPPDLILIEEKVSGYSLLQDLMRANLPVMAFNPGKYKGRKVGRCRLVSHLIENGLVWLPTEAPKHEYYTASSDTFLAAAITFPSQEANDVIDSMSQAFIRLTSTGWIANKEDPVDVFEPNWRTIDKPYY